MTQELWYRGWRGSVDYSRTDRVFHGRLLGIGDLVTFEDLSRQGLESAFREAVDDHIAFLAAAKKRARRKGSPA